MGCSTGTPKGESVKFWKGEEMKEAVWVVWKDYGERGIKIYDVHTDEESADWHIRKLEESGIKAVKSGGVVEFPALIAQM